MSRYILPSRSPKGGGASTAEKDRAREGAPLGHLQEDDDNAATVSKISVLCATAFVLT